MGGPLPRPSRREILAWCLYDFANSSYVTLIVTVAYSVYFTQVVAKDAPAEALWGRGNSLSMLIIGLLSPVLGAMADYSGTKKKFLLFFTLLCVIPTGALVFVTEGAIASGLLLYIIANIGFNGSLTFYNSFLREIADDENMGTVSGYGWALGYFGGLATLGLCYPLIKDGFASENLLNFRLSFLVTALFFLVFSLPTFLWLKERAVSRILPIWSLWGTGFRRVMVTLREIRKFRELAKFFLSYVIYNDGISTIIVFAAIFASGVLGFSPQEILIYFIVNQITSALGAYFFGPVSDRIGAKRTISLTLILWIGVIVWAFFVRTKLEFYALGVLAGLAIGSNQSASRTMLGLFVPPGKSTEFFGFFSFTEKLSAILGPLVYGEIASTTGSQRIAVLSIGAFFFAGLILLQWVNEAEGRKVAGSGVGPPYTL